MINALVELIIFLVVGGLIYTLLMAIPLFAPFKQAIQICCILIALLLVISLFFGGGGWLPHSGWWAR